jgi:PBSX family phage portal protein
MAETTIPATPSPPLDEMTLISFGEPESVLATNPADYLGITLGFDGYYTPPVSQTGLAKISRANAHHNRCGQFKKNLLIRDYIDNAVLPVEELERAALDFLFLGNCYFQVTRNRLGQVTQFSHLPGVRMRRRKGGLYGYVGANNEMIHFQPGEVEHLYEYDLSQQIYGVPPWFGAIHSVLLNEDATLFRRRYYRNGAHMGFILLTMDPRLSAADEQLLKDQISASKGVGNFRSMYINIPNQGDADKAITLIPIGEMKTNSDWEKIKNISRNDILSAWGVRPELAAMMPEGYASSGDLDKVVKLNYESEIKPLQIVFKKLNKVASTNPVQFNASQL